MSSWSYSNYRGKGRVWGLGNKRILLRHQRESTPNSSPVLWRQLFTILGWERRLQGGGRLSCKKGSLMVGDEHFKGIFNFKLHSPHEMELSASDTVLRMAQIEKHGAPPCLFGFCHGGILVALLNNGQMKEAF